MALRSPASSSSHKQSSINPFPLPLPSTQFSSQPNMLDSGTKLPSSHVDFSDHIGRRLSDSYGSYNHVMNYDSRVQKTAQNYANYRSSFGAETSRVEDDDESTGDSTPPLWRTSPSRSPSHRQNINYRCLSPTSKAQAIARGQKELMEMVSRMPESCYELSLKDLVEHQPMAVEPKKESFSEGRSGINDDTYKKDTIKKKKKKQSNQKKKPQIKRSGSIDNGGFLLKMVFPISLGSKKKNKKNDSNTNHNSKVSPKPTVTDSSGNKTVDKEWWKKRSGSSESESGGSSTMNSGSTKSSRSSSTSSNSSCSSISNTSSRHEKNGCLDFILTRKSKASR